MTSHAQPNTTLTGFVKVLFAHLWSTQYCKGDQVSMLTFRLDPRNDLIVKIFMGLGHRIITKSITQGVLWKTISHSTTCQGQDVPIAQWTQSSVPSLNYSP